MRTCEIFREESRNTNVIPKTDAVNSTVIHDGEKKTFVSSKCRYPIKEFYF